MGKPYEGFPFLIIKYKGGRNYDYYFWNYYGRDLSYANDNLGADSWYY
jgi:hypothetical protein